MTTTGIMATLTVAIGIGAAGFLPSGNRVAPARTPPTSGVDPLSVPVPVAFAKLEASRAPAPSTYARADMFSFAPAFMKTMPRAAGSGPEPGRALPKPSPTAESPLAVVGIAEDWNGAVLLRTAIITDGGEIWMVCAGQTVGATHRVTEVFAESVVLEDVRTNSTMRLVLR